MNELLKRFLNDFGGKDINVSLIGGISTVIRLQDLDYWILENKVEDDELVLRDNITEQEIHINLDAIEDICLDGEQVILVRDNGDMYQIWCDDIR